MRGYHWGMIFLFLVTGYLIGVWMPGPGQKLKTIVGM